MTTLINSAALVSPDAAPVMPAMTAPVPEAINLDQLRELQFKQRISYRLRHAAPGIMPDQIFQQVAAEQRVIAQTIADPAFNTIAGKALWDAKQGLTNDPAYATSVAHEVESIEQVMLRRAVEANANVVRANDPAFRAEIQAMAAAANDPAPLPALRGIKLTETMDDLLHRDAQGVPQVEAHIDAMRDGMIREHAALAKLFAPGGSFHLALAAGAKQRMPEVSDDVLREWLGDREAAATVTVDLLAGEGEAYVKALAVSKEEHAKKLGIAPTASHTAGVQASRDDLKIHVMGV